MAKIEIRETTINDVVELARNLRAADAAEMRAYGHDDYLPHLTRSALHSMLCWSAFADGKLACIIGVAPLSVMSGVGSPWMMGTHVLDQHQRVLVRRTPEYISKMLNAFPHLVNYVHAQNTTSVRWLRRLGFTLHDAQPYGALGEPFHKFEMRV